MIAPAVRAGEAVHAVAAHQFCAVSWRAGQARSDAVATGICAGLQLARPHWRTWRARDGAVVMSATAPALQSDRDALFGEAFRRAPSGRSQPLRADQFAAACASRTHQSDARTPAVAVFWGRFVSIHVGDDDMCIVRDPSGALPVFRARKDGVDLVFSDTALAFDLGVDGRALDWGFIAARLLDNRLLTHRSGLVGVTELEPGGWVALGAGLPRTHQYWSLADVAARSAATSAMTPAHAQTRLRHAVEDTVAALAARHASVVMRLSGGFDSAVVAAALVRPGGPDVACYNLATPGREGDERAYAQAMADYLGAPLRVHAMTATAVDLRRYDEGGSDAWRLRAVRPPLWIANQERDDADRACVTQAGASAILSGRGGDNAFFRCEYLWPAIDRIRALGWSAASIRYAFATARRTGQSVWAVMREAQGGKATPFPVVRARAGLTQKARDLAASLSAPAPRNDLPPGKRWHVELLDDRLNYIDLTTGLDVIHPLVAQPVMEACLETPAWLLASGDRDRGLARAAFDDALAPMLRARRGKGRTSGYLNGIVWENRAAIAGWLEGGQLAQAGLLAPHEVRRMLGDAAVGKVEGEAGALVAWSGVELWVRAAVAAGARV